MNQTELNKIAEHFLRDQSIEVAAKLRNALHEDAEERSQRIGGLALHYVHNISLFDCCVWLNSFFTMEDDSKEAVEEYVRYVETLRPKFLDLLESLRDFEPSA